MVQDEIENRPLQEAVPAIPSPRPRVGIGLLAAFLLHQSIYSVAALIALIAEVRGGSSTWQNALSSFLWLGAWTGGSVFFWKCKKPRLPEFTFPFTSFVVLWFFVAGCWGSPTGEAFSSAMFLACGTVWGLALLALKTGFVLGDGHQQREQIKRWISNFLPAFGRYHDAPQDILGRISSPPQTSPELPWQPSSPTTEALSQPLLPNALPREPSETK